MLYLQIKRLLDIAAGVTGILVFGIPMILIALAIKAGSPGPIFFTQDRVGKGGKIFRIYKFRSMVIEAEKILNQNRRLLTAYLNGNFKLEEDPRVTPIGKYLRKTSLDELPQFLNILRGEMSLVGPRAFRPGELKQQGKKFPETKKDIKTLLIIKPGLTGPWQISGRSEIGFSKRVRLDAQYARKKSLFYDFWIILKTPIAIVRGRGAY